MADTGKILALFASITLLLTLVFNIMPTWPRFPWDIYIRKGPVRFYIPILTSLVISVVLTIIFNYFRN